jgi:putative ABC transport system ATP-binding protein
MAVELRDVHRRFASVGGAVRAVDGITLSVPDRTFLSVVGRSGSGKSTLLALLGALDRPSEGTVRIDDHEVSALSERDLVDYRLRHVGFVFQDHGLVPDLSAKENVMLPMEFAGVPRAEREKRAAHLLDLVGLDSNKAERRPRRLSGGEQQRVAIARALANGPRLVLADEPTGNLDEENAARVASLLRLIVDKFGATVVLVTHDRDLAARADRMLEMRDGRLASLDGAKGPNSASPTGAGKVRRPAVADPVSPPR